MAGVHSRAKATYIEIETSKSPLIEVPEGALTEHDCSTDRPRLVRLISPTNASVHDLILVDSPKFHLLLDFAVHVEAYHLTIWGNNLGSYLTMALMPMGRTTTFTRMRWENSLTTSKEKLIGLGRSLRRVRLCEKFFSSCFG